jgi:hypothetical protein
VFHNSHYKIGGCYIELESYSLKLGEIGASLLPILLGGTIEGYTCK